MKPALIPCTVLVLLLIALTAIISKVFSNKFKSTDSKYVENI